MCVPTCLKDTKAVLGRHHLSSDQGILVSLVSFRLLQPLVGIPGRFILLVYPLDTRCLLSPEWSGLQQTASSTVVVPTTQEPNTAKKASVGNTNTDPALTEQDEE
ncbi:hypothetical protein L209DRAFT_34649 [Thermothelomyces heterothallicus CBS 203.75]